MIQHSNTMLLNLGHVKTKTAFNLHRGFTSVDDIKNIPHKPAPEATVLAATFKSRVPS
jgi:hypothetical protein